MVTLAWRHRWLAVDLASVEEMISPRVQPGPSHYLHREKNAVKFSKCGGDDLTKGTAWPKSLSSQGKNAWQAVQYVRFPSGPPPEY